MKKNVFLWALYDLANTPLTVALTGLYLAQWVVLDNHVDDIWYSIPFTIATVLLLVTSPFWGAWSDRIGKRMPFVSWATYLMLFFGTILSLVIVSHLDASPKLVIVLFLFLIMQYLYQISLIFYDSLLLDISTSKNRGHISGIGRFFGELGWLVGPAVLLIFATGQITLFGTPGRAQVFLPAVILLALLGLPMIFWFKERQVKVTRPKTNAKDIYTKTIRGFKDLVRTQKNVALFLLAFMLFSDAVLTSTLFFGIYLDQIYKISDTQKVIVLGITEIFAVLSAYGMGRISDRVGVKKMVFISCLTLSIGFLCIALFSSLTMLYFFVGIVGLGLGGFYPTARALLVKISPKKSLGEYFGFYATFERFASIIGPLIWGITTFLLKDYGIIRYRVAMLILIGLMFLGTGLFLKVKEEEKI